MRRVVEQHPVEIRHPKLKEALLVRGCKGRQAGGCLHACLHVAVCVWWGECVNDWLQSWLGRLATTRNPPTSSSTAILTNIIVTDAALSVALNPLAMHFIAHCIALCIALH